jgi:hypothetical protein
MISLHPHFVETVLDLACTIQQFPRLPSRRRRANFFLNQFCMLDLTDVTCDSAGNVYGLAYQVLAEPARWWSAPTWILFSQLARTW